MISGAPHVPHPRETADRCALRAALRGDPMLGTAFSARRVLLVEQPGPWGRAGLRESRFDAAVAARLETKAARLGIRTLAVRRPGRTPRGAVRRWALVDCRPGREGMRWGPFTEDGELLHLDLADAATSGRFDDRPVYLVCAHSRHDTCCALRGRPVAAALHARRPGRVWECSHLGGERFAANVLVLPYGLLYGRVLPFAAAEFVDVTDRGEVVESLLRGRVGLVPAAQAALAFAHAQLAVRRVVDLSVRSVRTVQPDQTVVRLTSPHGPVDVLVRSEPAAPHHLTCHALGPSAALIHRPVRLVPVLV